MTRKKIKRIISQVPVGYYRRMNCFQKWWHAGKFRAIKEALENEKPKSMLDLGCNDGTMTAKIAELFPNIQKVVAIDLFTLGIHFAKKLYPRIEFKVGDIQNLQLKGKFDLITCLETIEHVGKPEKLIEEIKKNLEDEGVVIIEMDSGNLFFKIAWFVWTKLGGKVWQGSHLWKTDKKKLKELLEKSDLKIEEMICFNLKMGVVFKLRKR